MEATMKDFLSKVGPNALEYEAAFVGRSVDDLLGMKVEDLDDLLFDIVPKATVRKGIWDELFAERMRRRTAREEVQFEGNREREEPEVVTLEENDLLPRRRKKKAKLDLDSEEDDIDSESWESGSSDFTLPAFKEKPHPKDIITLNIGRSRKNLKCSINLSWRRWKEWHSYGSLNPHNISAIYVHYIYPSEEFVPFHEWFLDPLPNLKRLELFDKVGARGGDNHWDAVSKIIKKACGGLREIVFNFKAKDDLSLNRFLTLISELPPRHLKGLKVLHLKNNCKERTLNAKQWALLKKIRAPGLRTLEIEFGFLEEPETVSIFQDLLKNFSESLTKLVVHGGFSTEQKNMPRVVIQFPNMPKLKTLDMGRSCQVEVIVENLTERPKKRSGRMRFAPIREEDEVEGPKPAEELSVIEPEDGIVSKNFFKVALNLPFTEKLEFLRFGVLYELQELHFSSFPASKTFLVASAWDTTVRFPGSGSRHFCYDALKELQFPNELDDPAFILAALQHFPKLEKIHLNLPTVAVVRELSRVLSLPPEEGNPCPLFNYLNLRMQFDFSANFEESMLNEPWTLTPNPEDLIKVKALKDYRYCENYVKVNRIQLPRFWSIGGSNPDEAANMANDGLRAGKGLEALKDKAFTAAKDFFVFECVPRKLRLPKRTWHFNDDRCEFSDILLGFVEDELVISRKITEALPANSFTTGLNISESEDLFVKRKGRTPRIEKIINVDPLLLTLKPEKFCKEETKTGEGNQATNGSIDECILLSD